MTTIAVPAPPKSAFNKNRPISDLLKGQLKHFYHIEASLPAELQSGMTARDYATEDGAAKYIAHLTNALKGLKQAKLPTPIRRSAKPSPATEAGLALAAGAADDGPQSEASSEEDAPEANAPGEKA
jgi:hypothetical protein